MTQMHPITGAVISSTTAQRTQAEEKSQHLRRVEQNRKNTPSGDTFEHRVESPNELDAVLEDQHQQQSSKRRQKHRSKPAPQDEGDQDHLDLTA